MRPAIDTRLESVGVLPFPVPLVRFERMDLRRVRIRDDGVISWDQRYVSKKSLTRTIRYRMNPEWRPDAGPCFELLDIGKVGQQANCKMRFSFIERELALVTRNGKSYDSTAR